MKSVEYLAEMTRAVSDFDEVELSSSRNKRGGNAFQRHLDCGICEA